MASGEVAIIGNQHRRLERLSPQDLSNLRIEGHGLPMDVAALIILDRGSTAGSSAWPDLNTVRTAVERHLPQVPRLRQVLRRPGTGLGPLVWVDDPGFDLRQHVRACPVPAPGDEPALLTVCSGLTASRLSRSRPLWELWLLPGLADGRAGVLIRLHHVVADGIAAVAMMQALFSCDPATLLPDAPAWRPQPTPVTRELLADGLRRRARAAAGVLARTRHPAAILARLHVLAGQAGEAVREGRAPSLSINVPVSGRRRLMLVRADLDRARTAAHAQGGTVNDVVLAAAAGGARSLLGARGELTPELVLKASVPASLRGPSDHQAGNRVAVMVVPLPLGEADPARRLAQIAMVTARRKRQPLFQPSARVLQRLMVRVMSRQRLINLVVSNVPGPSAPLYFAGSRVAEMFQLSALQGNITICLGVLSYDGQLNFGIAGDAEAVPDLALFAGGVSDTLGQLGVLAAAGSGRTTAR